MILQVSVKEASDPNFPPLRQCPESNHRTYPSYPDTSPDAIVQGIVVTPRLDIKALTPKFLPLKLDSYSLHRFFFPKIKWVGNHYVVTQVKSFQKYCVDFGDTPSLYKHFVLRPWRLFYNLPTKFIFYCIDLLKGH